MRVAKYLQNFSKIAAAFPPEVSEVQRVFHFGSFELSESQRLLSCDGRSVDLKAKDFDVLLVLLRNRPKLVTKTQLLAEVWPNSYVDEANLGVHIAELRKVLRRHSADWNSIQTIHKYGYRFVGDAYSTVEESAVSDVPQPVIRLVQGDENRREISDPEIGPGAMFTLEGLRVEAWKSSCGTRVMLAIPQQLNQVNISHSCTLRRFKRDTVLVTTYERDGTRYVIVDLDVDE
jgi:DNA-binding winged helix-turn-helix (wHTH) protein